MKNKKNDNSIIITTCGGQSEGVTGSVTMISYMKSNNTRGLILLELGGIQGRNTVYDEYLENKKLLEELPIEDVEYVFVEHSHQDHEMHLPYLVTKGFKGKVIMTNENYEITKRLLPDSTFIHKKNIEYLRAKGKKVKPFYTQKECYEVLKEIDIYEKNIIHKLNDNISFRFVNNSHVVGATQIELFIKKNSGQVKKILYTSDLGSKINKEFQPFLEDNFIVDKANVMMIESTYGLKERSFTKKDCQREREELKDIIKQYVLDNKSNCMIPCFSYGRLQNMMCLVYEMFKDSWDMDIPIVIDTALGNNINLAYDQILKGKDFEYWQKIKEWKPFKYIKDYNGTVAFLSTKQNALILSSSGMLNAGHSLIYAKHLLDSSKDVMCFCGYCSPNTIGGMILDKERKTVKIDKNVCLKRCEIKQFNTFSSHAQQKDLLEYIKHINCDKIILHHGDKEAKEELKKAAEEMLRENNKTTKVVCSYKDFQTIL